MLTRKHILEIKSCDQSNINKMSATFLNYLENDYLEFKKNWIKNNNEFKKYKKELNKKCIHFTPEKVLIKSPITILDSPWGIGKTYFLENTCKLVANDEIETKEIKSIIIIDALKFSICNSIPNEFIEELMLKFSWKNKIYRIIKKSLFVIFNIYFLPRINQKYNLLLSRLLYKKPTHEKAIKILNKTFSKPTLLIIDNIERMNEKSWEIIRTIQKLTILDNFIFLLPINKVVLNKNFEEKNSEWIIEKFINLPYYEFRQNFSGILKKYGMNKEQSEFINEYLNIPVDNKTKKILTLRQLETNLETINVEKIKNRGDICCLREISLFWKNDIKINEILRNKIYNFISSINELSSLIDKTKLKIKNNLYSRDIYKG
ncbi:MAG: KAP family NTPase, partial [Ureaplasma sp.]|nr:KAP family NTPase [Ureaplasma sp.]